MSSPRSPRPCSQEPQNNSKKDSASASSSATNQVCTTSGLGPRPSAERAQEIVRDVGGDRKGRTTTVETVMDVDKVSVTQVSKCTARCRLGRPTAQPTHSMERSTGMPGLERPPCVAARSRIVIASGVQRPFISRVTSQVMASVA